MSLQGHYLCKFPALYIIIINRMVACAHRVALAALRGGQAASAESCTHPAKRDHRFPPPIAERQRLPNVRIELGLGLWCAITPMQFTQSVTHSLSLSFFVFVITPLVSMNSSDATTNISKGCFASTLSTVWLIHKPIIIDNWEGYRYHKFYCAKRNLTQMICLLLREPSH